MLNKTLIAALAASAVFVGSAVHAQGLIGGAQQGADRGNAAAGPIGGIVGGAFGAATGTVGGVLGGDPLGVGGGGLFGAGLGGDQPGLGQYVAAQNIPSYPYRGAVRVGTRLPAGVTYYVVPPSYGPAASYRYTVVNGRIVLVAPRSHRVVQIIG